MRVPRAVEEFTTPRTEETAQLTVMMGVYDSPSILVEIYLAVSYCITLLNYEDI